MSAVGHKAGTRCARMLNAQRSAPRGAVFLSYASQDAEAARKICDALRAAGVEVWFDQSELRGGDTWDQKIRKQIKECTLFLPVISANTQARREGYFRLEWKLAEDRTHLMAKGTPFLVPVCIDDTKDWNALVPDSFMTVQWTRLASGESLNAFCERVKKLLADEADFVGRGLRTPQSSEPAVFDDGALQQRKSAVSPAKERNRTAPWVRNAAVVGGLLIGLIYALRPSNWAKRSETTRPPAAATSPAASASITAEFPRDPELRRVHKLIYSLDAIAEDYALADDIVKPLLAARPNDPEVATVAAEVSQEFLTRGFDLTQARRAQAQRLTERAVQLAPDNPDALAALGRYLLFINAQLGRAEELLRRAIELKPTEPRFHRTLYYILAVARRDAEADEFGARMAAAFPRDPLVAYDLARRAKDSNDPDAAEPWFDRALALAPLAYAMIWKAWFALELRGDVAEMKQWLDRIPERQRTNTRVVNAFAVHAGLTGQTATALQLLNAVADPWLTDFDFTGPKALLLGDLLRLDGRHELARLQYEAALAEIRRMQGAEPTNLRPRVAELWTLLGLGRREEARAAWPAVLQSLARPFRWSLRNTWWSGAIRAALLLDDRAAALALLREACVEPVGRRLLRQLFRVDPRMAPFRADPEIAALLAEPKDNKATTAAAPVSEGAQFTARAKALYTKLNYTREDLATAEELARKATEREPDSAAAWGVRAGIQATYVYRNWDSSEKRRQDTQAFASRALGLNPDEPEALLALGHLLRQQGVSAQAIAHFRRALAAEPANNRIARALGTSLSFEGKQEEGRAVLLEAVNRDPRDALVRYDLALTYDVFVSRGQVPANLALALDHLNAGLAAQPLASLLNAKAVTQGGWLGDLPAMRATLAQLEQLPLAERAEDRAVFIAMWGALLEHDAARVAAAAALTAKSYFEDSVVPRRPKDWSMALAHRLERKESSARLDWQRAEGVLRQRLRDDPTNQVLVVELATTLAWLGRTDEALREVGPAEAAAREEPLRGRSRALADFYGAAGDAAKAVPYLRQALNRTVFLTAKTLPLDSWFDKLRGQPEFEALLKETASKQ